ncbi:MAG: deoxyguanosinetriphosphate triphosphohydrolase [Pirellulales bacterium]
MPDPFSHSLPVEMLAREEHLLAPYAMRASRSAGRKHPEPPHPYRTPFQRDRDRIIHSAAYRRLSYKTQVFTGEMGDYHRTRLTHTLEVASISRNLGRALRLNEDLIETLALAHDLGHPPFGHAGEDALDECLRDVGGFSHNRHGLRIVELLEQRYADFPGLNLSREVLEGQATRIDKDVSQARPLLEVQVVEAADSVAYDTHDADDAMRLGLLKVEDLLEMPLWQQAARRVRQRWTNLPPRQLERAILHELLNWQVGDLLTKAMERLQAGEIDSPDAVRAAAPLIVPSPDIAEQKLQLERFLHQRVYRHPQVLRMRTEAQDSLRQMFALFQQRMDLLPESFQRRASEVGAAQTVGDYLAGMTDRFAQQQFAKYQTAGEI